MQQAIFKDAGVEPGVHQGFVEHDELEISDQELEQLKGRARRAVTMDEEAPIMPEDNSPGEYRAFLHGGSETKTSTFEGFLRGEHGRRDDE